MKRVLSTALLLMQMSAAMAQEWIPIGKAVYTEDLLSVYVDGVAGQSWEVDLEV